MKYIKIGTNCLSGDCGLFQIDLKGWSVCKEKHTWEVAQKGKDYEKIIPIT